MTQKQKQIEIYTLDYCPYCMKAKIFFQEHGLVYSEISCEDNEDEIRIELTKKYNLKSLATFPQIIVNSKNIGGYSDMIEKYSNNEISFYED